MTKLLIQLFSLSLYTLFVGFCFCDGFKLHILRKLIWSFVFIFISIYIFKIKNEFDLALILPLPTLLATFFCAYEKIRMKNK